jgi:ELWxxDGT repeat protein
MFGCTTVASVPSFSIEALESRRLLASSVIVDLTAGPEGSEIIPLGGVNERGIFAAPAGIYATDGTAGGTIRIINSLTATPEPGVTLRDTLYFQMGDRLWATDGTAAGTRVVSQRFTLQHEPTNAKLTTWNGELYFFGFEPRADTGGLYRSDGTEAGTRLAADLGLSRVPWGKAIVPAHRRLYVERGGETGSGFFYTDGTPEDTHFIPLPGGDGLYRPSGLRRDGDSVQFGAYDRRQPLPGGWVLRIWEIHPDLTVTLIGNSAGVQRTPEVASGEWVYQGIGADLYRRSASGDLMLVKADVFPRNLFDYNGTLVFQGFDETHGRELWQSDGTGDGTRLLDDVNPGSADSEPHAFAVNDDALFFVGTTPGFGREPMRFDPTAAALPAVRTPLNTVRLADDFMSDAREHFEEDAVLLWLK